MAPLVHATNAPPSIEHSNVAVPSADENVKVGVESLDGLVGVESSVVSGAAVSTVQLCVAGVRSGLPIESVALTSKV